MKLSNRIEQLLEDYSNDFKAQQRADVMAYENKGNVDLEEYAYKRRLILSITSCELDNAVSNLAFAIFASMKMGLYDSVEGAARAYGCKTIISDKRVRQRLDKQLEKLGDADD